MSRCRVLPWLLLLLSASAAVATAAPPPASKYKPEEQARYLADGPDKVLVATRCANCHVAGNFTKFRKNEEQWAETLDDMATNRNAEIPEADYDKILAYLVANYGPGAKLSVNRAPVEELVKMLVISKDEAKSLAEYREKNGQFRNFEDLLKVPGLDAKKLESKRELLVF